MPPIKQLLMRLPYVLGAVVWSCFVVAFYDLCRLFLQIYSTHFQSDIFISLIYRFLKSIKILLLKVDGFCHQLSMVSLQNVQLFWVQRYFDGQQLTLNKISMILSPCKNAAKEFQNSFSFGCFCDQEKQPRVIYIFLSFDLNINYNLTGNLIQMELLKQLSSTQQDQFNRIRAIQNGIEDRTLDQSLKYYVEYKKNTTGHIPHEKLPIVFKSALFMAEKSTCCNTVNGERIAEPSLTLGHLLKSHPLDQVMITLKDFTKNVNINDKQAAAELNNLIKEISFLITFHKKFEKSVEKFELRERYPESGEYVKYWSHFAWLLFIQVRSKLLMKSLDLIENTCMLAHTLAFMLSYSFEHIIPTGILKQQKKINEQSQFNQIKFVIRDRVLDMFSIKTVDIYTSLATTFENFFDMDLIKRGIIKIHKNFDFLSPDLLMTNYRRLDKFYEKNMNGIDLDERVFLRERTVNMTPSKFTPFARQGYANRGRKSGQNDVTLRQNCSHRVLNYQLSQKQENTIKIGGQGVTIGRLPKAIVASPSMMKVPLILATPISAGMEMLNYVNDKAKKFQETLSQGYIPKRPHESAVIKHIDLVFDKSKKEMDKKAKEPKEQMVYSFFKLALEEYLSQHPSEKDNEKCYKALMAISIELVLFANNSSMMFEDVERQINVQPFELWKACDFFMKFDKAMPSSLKIHLLDIEVGFVSYKVWKEFDFIEMIHQFSNGQKINNPSMAQFFQGFFKRLLHQTAFQIHQISDRLKLQEGVLEAIYDMMKHIISESTDLLENRHLDQLIMCTIYAINKKERLDIKFGQIIDAYKDANYYNRDMHETLVKQINVEGKQPLNLISYYNQCYIKRLKDFVMNIKTSDYHQDNKKSYANNPILMSPLKDILPKDMSKRNTNKMVNKNDANSHKDLLVAYTDSPLLRHQPMAFKNKELRVPTGMINFDQQNEEIIKVNLQEQKKQYDKHSPRNVSNYTTEVSKKPSINNIVGGLWKQPDPMSGNGGLTPNRSKNVAPQPTVPLNQFNSNSSQNSNVPPPPRTTTNNPPQNKTLFTQFGMSNLAKGGIRKYQ